MSERTIAAQPKGPAPLRPRQNSALQRQCACGTHTAGGGECAECSKKKSGLQRKLSIGESDDPLELEADRVADKVLATPTHAAVSGTPPRIQRFAGQPVGETGTAPASVDHVLADSGRPLDPSLRQDMEQRFGHDFSQVQVHSDSAAEQSARDVNASAYTVRHHIVFGAGHFSPGTHAGRRLIAHELTHVVQQSGAESWQGVRGDGKGGLSAIGSQQSSGRSPVAAAVQRKVILNSTEMPAKDRKAFLTTRKWTSQSLASTVIEDMAAAADSFDFKDEAELESEIRKRLSTVSHMEESQKTTEKIPGDKRSAFGYPFTGASLLYGPRVNYVAREYWEPVVSDGYAVRTDKAKNAQLKAKPRHERCSVYGDPCGDYGWKLSKKGQADPYHAIAYLFAPQPPHKRALIHCDYLISLVNFMSMADAIGEAEFNKRVAAFGADKIVLKWNAFQDLHTVSFERTTSGDWKKDSAGSAKAIWGLRSTQRVRPSSEADLVIGDHVVFFNHLAYDLINEKVGNAWRLENAVLVGKSKGKDRFLGHGSGYKTADEMRAKLAEEYNDVANKALGLVAKTQSIDKKVKAAAQSDLATKFPNVKQVGVDWKAQGVPGLLKDSACPKTVDEKLRQIKPSEVIGPKSPCDPTKMNEVERPIESAK
jgi:hypothetical protein